MAAVIRRYRRAGSLDGHGGQEGVEPASGVLVRNESLRAHRPTLVGPGIHEPVPAPGAGHTATALRAPTRRQMQLSHAPNKPRLLLPSLPPTVASRAETESHQLDHGVRPASSGSLATMALRPVPAPSPTLSTASSSPTPEAGRSPPGVSRLASLSGRLRSARPRRRPAGAPARCARLAPTAKQLQLRPALPLVPGQRRHLHRRPAELGESERIACHPVDQVRELIRRGEQRRAVAHRTAGRSRPRHSGRSPRPV